MSDYNSKKRITKLIEKTFNIGEIQQAEEKLNQTTLPIPVH